MALSLGDANLVKQRAFGETRKAKIQLLLKTFFSYLVQHKGNIDLQLVNFSELVNTNVVIADSPCKLYAAFVSSKVGSSTAAFWKGTDNATTGSGTAPEVGIKIAGAATELFVWPDGLSLAAGLTLLGHTTADGVTGSNAADRLFGYCIIGAP
jgi:hypothetical protein